MQIWAFKGTVQPEMNILLSFTHPHFIPNLCDFVLQIICGFLVTEQFWWPSTSILWIKNAFSEYFTLCSTEKNLSYRNCNFRVNVFKNVLFKPFFSVPCWLLYSVDFRTEAQYIFLCICFWLRLRKKRCRFPRPLAAPSRIPLLSGNSPTQKQQLLAA